MVLLDRLGPAGEVVERVAVRGQHERHVGPVGGDLVERLEEASSGSPLRVEAADVRGDRRQHVVAREHHALRRVEQAEVVVGVTGRVQGDPLAPGEADDLGVGEADASAPAS